MNLPDKAVVFYLDGKKNQIHALDRTQPSLPMKRGRAGTMRHNAAFGQLRSRREKLWPKACH
jgi:hypothetical protein